MAPQTISKDDVVRQQEDGAQQSWMNELKHTQGEYEVHEERDIPPKDPTKQRFDALVLSMMKNIAEKM